MSRRDQTYSHAMTLEFATKQDLEAYLDSAEHERFVAMQFKSAIDIRAIASFEDNTGTE